MKLDKIKFAKLIGQIQYIVNRSDVVSEDDIEAIDYIVDFDIPAAEKVYVSCDAVDEMLAAIASNREIDAIKAYRTITGAGLKESKDAIEAHWVRQTPSQPSANLGDILHNATGSK